MFDEINRVPSLIFDQETKFLKGTVCTFVSADEPVSATARSWDHSL